MFRTAIRQAAQKASTSTASNSSELPQAFVKLPHISPALLTQYPAKKTWPPDFKTMSPQEQLKYEKRYKRKIHHIAQRPRWNKMVQLAQLGTISFVLIYCLLFADWKDERQPFYEFRQWFWNSLGFEYEAPKPVARIQSQESQASVQGGSRPRQM
ncbi:hypothetical protein NEUTE1DRAFT_146847 [Neurospora tetrasperma FGSC 2508]|uniref:Uncharacterized protein n=2 Tax=Neurospora TaxID=5140 RepID=F8MRF3_NEUT8|nr:uncharacterized protein NEUTE1DRAFT_146847 [Neurospora tetrasperma FGSC 2508]EGO56062.1 hypothetical protein NEUTE1DRAFT_146847 [Neurospora tetrasperma FGSC 2508]EGZ71091.1 hypothetical protein NEUTE2DRAFT_159330 [Neurospora tetrasperma FGSC 2509]